MQVSNTLFSWTYRSRFTLDGQWKGTESPILDVWIDDDTIIAILLDPHTNNVIEKLDSVAFATVM
jgi:hypothetical protein